jgi:thiosulfate/3-mercaptopyruvate sulfurtransferase
MLVTPQWLHEHREDPDFVVVDCAREDAAYPRAHIPGALLRPGHAFVKQEDDQGEPGLFLPDERAVAALAHDLGIGAGTTVVAYDDKGGIFAARLWWVLRYYSFEGVRLLDGGWHAWAHAGLPVSTRKGKWRRPSQAWEPQARPALKTTLDELRSHLDDPSWQVLDVRSLEEHEAMEEEPENDRQGHLPGAVHLEWNEFVENSTDPEAVRRLRSGTEIEELLSEVGVRSDTTVVTHCQAGVRGAFAAFVLELVGRPAARLYDGSMAEWANREDTPLE